MFNRREFLAAAPGLGAARALYGAGAIESIEHKGVLIGECSLPGERRSDGAVPAHPNGIQASRNRWLLLYATRSFRGVDDDLSIVYQIRDRTADGKQLREGFLARIERNWSPEGPGRGNYVRQLGHPVLFGVPKGARVGGRLAPSSNVFVAKWRRTARYIDPDTNALVPERDKYLTLAMQAVEWVQFRLNDAEDDIEIIQPRTELRQKGYNTGPAFSSAPVKTINESFVQAVPYSRDGTIWADCMHFDGGRLACLKYVFNPRLRRYEWTETGPLFGDEGQGLFEASLARLGGRWVICARKRTPGVAWALVDHPFDRPPAMTTVDVPATSTPRTAYVWADGVLRLFTGDPGISPHHNPRDPLYCWDVDPRAQFAASNRRIIFDSVAAGLPIRPETRPMIDMCKLLPHAGGRSQWIVHRVHVAASERPRESTSSPGRLLPRVNAAERGACAIYYARVNYRESFPGLWEF